MSGVLSPGSSPEAASAIRRFSMLTWTIGTIVVGLIAVIAFPRIGINPYTGAILVGDGIAAADYAGDYAWNGESPRELEIVDGEISGGAGGGYVRIDGGSDILSLTLASGARDDWITVSYQKGRQTDRTADDWEYPSFLGGLYEENPTMVVPADEDGILWFSGATADWTARVEVPETTPLTGTLSGSGDAVLVYEGDALSGTFAHEGTGIFIVGATTSDGWQSLVNDADDVSTRASWDAADRIVFDILADTGDGTWTITLDTPGAATGPATDAATDPTDQTEETP